MSRRTTTSRVRRALADLKLGLFLVVGYVIAIVIAIAIIGIGSALARVVW